MAITPGMVRISTPPESFWATDVTRLGERSVSDARFPMNRTAQAETPGRLVKPTVSIRSPGDLGAIRVAATQQGRS